MKDFTKEWLISAPWGRIAVVSFGNPKGDPVLLVHGRQDSVATFLPLLNMLPGNYNYIGFDLPGHGKSDPFPIGVTLMRLHFLAAVEVVVKHLQWTKFIYLSHSMGGELGQITKLILLDILPAIWSLKTLPMSTFYSMYYGNAYKKITDDGKRVLSEAGALSAVMRARALNEEQAALVLSRNMVCVGNDQYKLSWNKRLKLPAHLNLREEYYTQLFSKLPPTLFVAAQNSYTKFAIDNLLHSWRENKCFVFKVVVGTHDVHLTNPERIVPLICPFLERLNECSKL